MCPAVGSSPREGLVKGHLSPRGSLPALRCTQAFWEPLCRTHGVAVWPALKPALSRSKSSDRQPGGPSCGRPVHCPGATPAQAGTQPRPRESRDEPAPGPGHRPCRHPLGTRVRVGLHSATSGQPDVPSSLVRAGCGLGRRAGDRTPGALVGCACASQILSFPS